MDRLNLRGFDAVVFDLFHTLTRLDPPEPGLPATSEILGVSRREWNEQLLHHSDNRLRGRTTDPYAIVEELAHRIKPAIPEETLRKAAEVRERRFRSLLMTIDEGVLRTLGELKGSGKRLGLLSNADQMEVAGWVDSPLSSLFDETVFSCQSGCVKPERRAYEICLEGLGCSPELSLFVGDGGDHELAGAKDVGMTTVLTTHVVRKLWPEVLEGRRGFADYEVDRIDELLPH
jgi:putative hydrolase of the HAD superfamily